jgi:hypothetical protein
VLLCTEPFAPVAAREAASAGLADLERLTVPHDLRSLGDEARRALAGRVVEAALQALTAPGGSASPGGPRG